MSFVSNIVFEEGNGYYYTYCPVCDEMIYVSTSEKEMFDEGKSVYMVCDSAECKSSFYLEK